MTRVPIPPTPDLLTPWRTRILQDLAAAGIPAAVGPKRPADTVNLAASFVRIMCLGGPWRARALWFPRLACESWAPSVKDAQRLDAIVGRATARLAGLHVAPTSPDHPGFYISTVQLALAGADQSLDGAPFVLTTTEPVCVQVIQQLPEEGTDE